jgi:hypothetical protein
VGPFRLADEVKQWKQKMAKWKGKVAERLQILEKRARGESIDTVHDRLACFFFFSAIFFSFGLFRVFAGMDSWTLIRMNFQRYDMGCMTSVCTPTYALLLSTSFGCSGNEQ